MINHLNDEFLDIVNENDEVIGKQLRSEAYSQNRSNFRVVNGFLENDQGQLWIPRRAATKRIFPLALDISMGGHVEHEEEYDSAFFRETLEELNLDPRIVGYDVIGKCTPHQHRVSAFMKVYRVKTNETPEYNKKDFIESFWISPKELLEKIDKGEKAKDDLPKLVKIFYGK